MFLFREDRAFAATRLSIFDYKKDSILNPTLKSRDTSTKQTIFNMDTNIYEACNDLITEFQSHKVSPDEILATKINHLVPIPFKTREDLQKDTENDKNEGLFHGELLPRIDLKVLHYFATQLCLQKYPHLINTMDETCMITLGLLVEQWIEEYLTSMNSDSSDTEDEEQSQDTQDTDERINNNDDNSHRAKRLCVGKGPSQLVAKTNSKKSDSADI